MTRFSDLATPAATRAHLEAWGLHTKKSLGQHFLIDDGVVGRILKLADSKTGNYVIEVGPGIGTLTMALLASGANVVAIEKDKDLLEPLRATFAGEERFKLIAADALDLESIKKDSGAIMGVSSVKLVANLPYAVAATIVLAYFEHLPALVDATVMVQREVAERMTASPDTKKYGAYTVKLRLLAQHAGTFRVARTSFMPPPRVDSTVIRLERHASPIDQRLYEATSFVVNAAFAQRRKTIRNSMRAYFAEHGKDVNMVDTVLEQANIDPQCRAETLDVDEFQRAGTVFLQV